MSEAKKQVDDGGPAFPKTGNFSDAQRSQFDSIDQGGMSLRDYFAAKAIQGIITSPDLMNEASAFRSGIGARDAIVAFAYDMADAMIAARKAGAK